MEKCSRCQEPITPENKLLRAIFGEPSDLCWRCYQESKILRCKVCQAPARFKVEDEPYCKEHLKERIYG